MEREILATLSIFIIHLYMTKMYINRLLYIWLDSPYLATEAIARTIFNSILLMICILITLYYIPYYHPNNVIIRILIVILIIILIIYYYKKEKKEYTKYKNS